MAFIASERFAALDEASKQRMPFAPDLAVELRSPGVRERKIARKIDLYLAHGSLVVLDIDPRGETIVAHDAGGALS